MTPKYFARALGHSPIANEVRRDKDSSGAQTLGVDCRHGRAHSKTPRFIGRCADNGAVTLPGHNDGLTAQARFIPLFNGSIRRVHIDMDNLADCHLRSILPVALRVARSAVSFFGSHANSKALASNEDHS